jgi:nucleotide-binding universal stress UspA family protein
MIPIQNILHPTDFSQHSEFAFRLAAALARDYDAKLVILHVAQQPVIMYTEGIIPAQPEHHEEELREQLLQLQVQHPNVHVVHLLEDGNPGEEILRIADEFPADLIVMGTHGRRGLQRLLMGSVAEYVLERASCPVLTVKTPVPDQPWRPDVTAEKLVRT